MTLQDDSLRTNSVYCRSCQNIFSGKWKSCRQIPLFEKCQQLWHRYIYAKKASPQFSRYPGMDGKAYLFHGTFSTLRDCATNQGCPFCKVIVDGGMWQDQKKSLRLAFTHIERPDILEIHFAKKDFKSTPLYRFGMFLVEEPELSYFIRPSIGTYNFSQASQTFITDKFSNCKTNHKLCHDSTDGDFFPTRVLDVGGSSPSIIKLVLSTQLPPGQHQYATLSHCWGKAQLTVLKTALLAPFSTTGIPFTSLPKTFQQTITVTRFLNIRYLWIDSLCIIQDSAADWAIESALMAHVYGSAVVNIAAASSPDSRGGLFYDRDPAVVQPFAAYVSGVPALAEGWYLWKNSHRWAAVGEQPLHRRGWVLQERLLSARTVHFSRSEVVWHCLEDLASEAVPERPVLDATEEARMETAQVGDYTDMRMTVARAQQDGLTERHRERLRLDWKRVLAHYTRCGLTQQRDKLVALSGIVQRLEAVLGDECLAGLWRGEMPACLAWYADWGDVEDGRDDRQRGMAPQSEDWLAPSWSWASRNIPIEYPQYDDETVRHAMVVTAAVESQANGLALSGHMVIRGPLVDLSFGMKEDGEMGNEVKGELGFVGDGIEATFTVWMDGVVSHDSKTTKAMLILEDYRYIFLLLQQLPGCDGMESNLARFQRIGLGVMEREFWAGVDDVEALDFVSGATSDNLDVKRSTWAPYIQQINLE